MPKHEDGSNIEMDDIDLQPLTENKSEANQETEASGQGTGIEQAFKQLGILQKQQQSQETGANGDENLERDLDRQIAGRVKNITEEELRSFISKVEWVEILKKSQYEACILSVVEQLVDNYSIEENDALQFVKQFEEKKLRNMEGPLVGKMIERKWKEMASYIFDCMMVETVKEWKIDYRILEEPFDSQGRRTVYQELSTRFHSDLVDHSLMRLLTHTKWKNIRSKRLVCGIPYMLTLICLTIVLCTSVDAVNVKVYNSGWDYARGVFEGLSCLLVFIKLIIEIVQLWQSGRHYFYDPLNWMELGACVVLFLITLPLRFAETKCHWYFFAVGYATWVLLLYKYAALYRPMFFQAQIFIQVIRRDVPMFGCLFLVINLGFAGALYLVLRGEGDLKLDNSDIRSWWKIFFMGIRTLAEGQPVLDYAETYGSISIFVMVVFLFVVVVTLLNMLIAQLGQTLDNVNETMCRNYQANLAATVAWMEINRPGVVNKHCSFDVGCCGKKTVESCPTVKDAERLKILQPRQSIMEKVQKRVDSLKDKQDEMAKNIEKIKDDQKSDVGQMKEIQKKLKKCFEEFNCVESVDILDALRDMKKMVEEACRGKISEVRDTDDAKGARDKLGLGPIKMLEAQASGLDEVDRSHTGAIGLINLEEWKRVLEDEPQEIIVGEIERYIGEGKKPADVKFEDGKTPLDIAAEKGYFYVVGKLLELDGNSWENMENALRRALDSDNKYDHLAASLVEHMNSKDPNRLKMLFIAPDGKDEATIKIAEYFEMDYKHFQTAVMDTMWNDGKVDLELFEKDKKGNKRKDKEPSIFHALANSGETDLFSHIVVQYLIWQKWKKNGYFKQFCVHMVCYLLSLVCLTVACVLSVESHDVKQYSNTKDYVRIVFEFLSLLCVLFTLGSEVVQIIREGIKLYIKDYINLVELFSSVLLLLALPIRFAAIDCHWYLLAVGYFLWVLIAFKYSTIHRGFGTYAQSLYLIITQDMVQFMCLFVVILTAFSGSYLLVLKGDNLVQHHNETSTFLAIAFNGLRAMADGQNSVAYYGEDGYKLCVSTFVMVAFLFVTIVILLNILIAQLSNTYTNIQGDAQNADWARKAQTIARLERQGKWLSRLYCKWLSRLYCKCIKGQDSATATQEDNVREFSRHFSIQSSTVNRIDDRVEDLVKKTPSVECKILALSGESRKSEQIKKDIKGEVNVIKQYFEDLVQKLEEVKNTLKVESKELKEEIKKFNKNV